MMPKLLSRLTGVGWNSDHTINPSAISVRIAEAYNSFTGHLRTGASRTGAPGRGSLRSRS